MVRVQEIHVVFMSVLGIKLRSLGLCGKLLNPLSHLIAYELPHIHTALLFSITILMSNTLSPCSYM